MKITLITVGKIKEKFLEAAIAEYSKRLSRYCKLEIIQVADEKTPDKAGEVLETQIKEEKDRTKEIEKYKEYVGTDAYVEDVAKEKFGLVYEDEIVLKPTK